MSVDVPGEAELQALHEAWDPFLSYDLSAVVFPTTSASASSSSSRKSDPPTQDSIVNGIIGLLAQLDSPLFMQHTDLL